MLDMGRMPRGVSYRLANFLTVLPSLTRADYQALSHISANTAQPDIAEILAAGLILRGGAGPSSRCCLADHRRKIPPRSPRYHGRVTQQSPSDLHEVAIQSPSDPHDIAAGSPQSELEQALASISGSLSVQTQGGLIVLKSPQPIYSQVDLVE